VTHSTLDAQLLHEFEEARKPVASMPPTTDFLSPRKPLVSYCTSFGGKGLLRDLPGFAVYQAFLVGYVGFVSEPDGLVVILQRALHVAFEAARKAPVVVGEGKVGLEPDDGAREIASRLDGGAGREAAGRNAVAFADQPRVIRQDPSRGNNDRGLRPWRAAGWSRAVGS
jgi:hypothetical protein